MGHLASMQAYPNIVFYLSPQSLPLALEQLVGTFNKGYKGHVVCDHSNARVLSSTFIY